MSAPVTVEHNEPCRDTQSCLRFSPCAWTDELEVEQQWLSWGSCVDEDSLFDWGFDEALQSHRPDEEDIAAIFEKNVWTTALAPCPAASPAGGIEEAGHGHTAAGLRHKLRRGAAAGAARAARHRQRPDADDIARPKKSPMTRNDIAALRLAGRRMVTRLPPRSSQADDLKDIWCDRPAWRSDSDLRLLFLESSTARLGADTCAELSADDFPGLACLGSMWPDQRKVEGREHVR